LDNKMFSTFNIDRPGEMGQLIVPLAHANVRVNITKQ
jgi:hypothetical protein